MGFNRYAQYFAPARLVVIVLRATWGTTPWTRVEMEAITDRFLKEGPEFLFVVTTDDGTIRPPWLPDKLLRFNLQYFPVEQAIGAIKLRCVERGGALAQPTIAERAATLRTRAEFEKKRSQLLHSAEGVKAAENSTTRLIGLISDRVRDASESLNALGIEFGQADTWCALRTRAAGIQCAYRNNIINVLTDARFHVREIRGGLILPGENAIYHTQPKVLVDHVFKPDIDSALGWGWRASDGKFATCETVADMFATNMLALVEADAAGKLPNLW